MTIQAFSAIIPDVRDDKNKIYQSNEIVFISLVSVICGADTWNEIETFGKTHESYFKAVFRGWFLFLLMIPCAVSFPYWISTGLKNVSGCGLMTSAGKFPE